MGARNLFVLFFLVTSTRVQFGRSLPFPDFSGNTEKSTDIGNHQDDSFNITNLVQELCAKNGGPNEFNNFMTESNKCQNCINDVVGEAERKRSAFKENFILGKYCKKAPEILACSADTFKALEPCMAESEKMIPKNFKTLLEALNDFACQHEGDGGIAFSDVGCISQTESALRSCVEPLSKKYPALGELKKEGFLIGYLLLKLGEPECQDVFEMQDCFVRELKTCKSPNQANYVQSLFGFVNRKTLCNNFSKNGLQKKN